MDAGCESKSSEYYDILHPNTVIFCTKCLHNLNIVTPTTELYHWVWHDLFVYIYTRRISNESAYYDIPHGTFAESDSTTEPCHWVWHGSFVYTHECRISKYSADCMGVSWLICSISHVSCAPPTLLALSHRRPCSYLHRCRVCEYNAHSEYKCT